MPVNSATDTELVISRTLNAPVELVWEVWTNPEHIKNWWGPAGFTDTIFKMEVKTGGVWEHVMHGPDGTDYKNKSVFKEVEFHKKIVFEHVSGPKFRATITFTAEGNKTHLNWRMQFESAEQLRQVIEVFKADEGLKQNVIKLEGYLVQFTSTKDQAPFIIERTYNAPVEKVWKAITHKEEMKQWYFDLKEFKPEVGFGFQFYGQGHKGEQYLHLCRVTEVVPHKKLSYSWSYEGLPGMSYVTFELYPEGSMTRLRLTHTGLETFPGSANPDFAKDSFMQGWTHITGISLKSYLEKSVA